MCPFFLVIAFFSRPPEYKLLPVYQASFLYRCLSLAAPFSCAGFRAIIRGRRFRLRPLLLLLSLYPISCSLSIRCLIRFAPLPFEFGIVDFLEAGCKPGIQAGLRTD